MHVEMSLDNQELESTEESRPAPSDTQTISGSQVATAFARINEQQSQAEKQISGAQMLGISIASVMSVVLVYMVLVFLV